VAALAHHAERGRSVGGEPPAHLAGPRRWPERDRPGLAGGRHPFGPLLERGCEGAQGSGRQRRAAPPGAEVDRERILSTASRVEIGPPYELAARATRLAATSRRRLQCPYGYAVPAAAARSREIARSELAIAWIATGLIALHVLDDNFLQPEPGTSAGDHLVSGLVPLAVLLGLAFVYPRARAGARASIALSLGIFGIAVGASEALLLHDQGRRLPRRLHRVSRAGRRCRARRPRRGHALAVETHGRPARTQVRAESAAHVCRPDRLRRARDAGRRLLRVHPRDVPSFVAIRGK
jgi:hypothetical protein